MEANIFQDIFHNLFHRAVVFLLWVNVFICDEKIHVNVLGFWVNFDIDSLSHVLYVNI